MQMPFPSLEQLQQSKILVVGDVMLDRYWFGQVDRISPEAPVPIVQIDHQEMRLGGAANVARNIAGLGSKVGLLSVVGDDEPGQCLRNLLVENQIAAHLLVDCDLPTTIKLRVLAHQQQLLRVDFEKMPNSQIVKQGLQQFKQLLPSYSTIVFSDYAKGSLLHVEEMIADARACQVQVLVDPKGNDWEKYRFANLITPNRAELKQVIGDWSDEANLMQRVAMLRKALAIEALLLTRSEEGMTLFTDEGRWHVPTVAREVFDVSGAGDTVIGTMAVLLSSGMGMKEAVFFANRAAGIVVNKLGTATVCFDELFVENDAILNE